MSCWSKQCFNKDCRPLVEEASKLCARFSEIYQQWIAENGLEHLALPPRELNQLYRLLSPARQPPDYNALVDKLVTLSHAYHPDKHKQNSSRKRSRAFSGHSCQEREGTWGRKLPRINLQFTAPKLPQLEEGEREEVESLTLFGLFRPGESVFGEVGRTGESQKLSHGLLEASWGANLPFPSLYMNQSREECEYIEVGLCEGESADLIAFGEAFASAFLARKGVSQDGDSKTVLGNPS